MTVRLEWASATVARLIIDNPAHRNAVTLAMWGELSSHCAALADSPARVVILRGAGETAFSTGADLWEFQTQRNDPAAVARYDAAISAAMAAVRDLPMPVIAQLSGLCVGGGLALAAMADLRIAGADCRFGIPAGKLGIAYRRDWIDRIAGLTGTAPVTEMLLTAAMVPADVALRWGLINRLCPALELAATVEDDARRMSALAPLSLRATKAALAARAGHGTPAEADRMVVACDLSQDYQRGIDAFRSGVVPQFEGN
ncbi:enoyl-CoA hydratase-related protein [Rhizobium sp. TRM95111]|uniref:enoyl-CoA hydratase-related protein n=1 Tax=Rhizobium alarense TaxID=2846851 RepID=UPI001F17188B|nr:enoyl-CoA hydratase-related protein [Rhizobium alarense]MCF3639809.1 enoyl-CoA hydratase-related protein [Rhizobium alarense]